MTYQRHTYVHRIHVFLASFSRNVVVVRASGWLQKEGAKSTSRRGDGQLAAGTEKKKGTKP